jgi:lactoylglutathione lyase
MVNLIRLHLSRICNKFILCGMFDKDNMEQTSIHYFCPCSLRTLTNIKDGGNNMLCFVAKISNSYELRKPNERRRKLILQLVILRQWLLYNATSTLYLWACITATMFNKIGAVILLVSDMKRSTKFYRETLGMKLKNQSKDWTEFSEGGTVLALHPSGRKKIKKNNSMLVGFSVSDFDDVISGLRKRKAKFYKKPKDESFGKHDGHLISIVQMPQEELSQIPYYHGFAPV